MGIRNVGSRPPSSPDHIADKEYVDDQVGTKYSKPNGGIPESDMDSSVKSALGKARDSVQPDDPRLTDSRTPKTHMHEGDQIEFNTTFDGDPVSMFGNTVAWQTLKNKDDIENHTHEIKDVSGLEDALDDIVKVETVSTLPANPDAGTLYVTTGDASPVPGLNDKVDAYQGQQLVMWAGTETDYDALPSNVKDDPGFIALITEDD